MHVTIGGFGPLALGREHSWLTISGVRQHVWTKADGQLTQLAHECAKWFFQRTGTDVRDVGINLVLKGGRQVRVFLELAVIAGDAPGIKEVLASKGHGGAKPCALCQNCVLHTHPRAERGDGLHQHDDWIVSIAETDFSRFASGTQAALLGAAHDASVARATLWSDRSRAGERSSHGRR